MEENGLDPGNKGENVFGCQNRNAEKKMGAISTESLDQSSGKK